MLNFFKFKKRVG